MAKSTAALPAPRQPAHDIPPRTEDSKPQDLGHQLEDVGAEDLSDPVGSPERRSIGGDSTRSSKTAGGHHGPVRVM